MTFRTIARLWHPRHRPHRFLLHLSATTELLIINLIPQHDPQPDPQLAGYRHARLSQTFVNQFAAIETLQLGIAACRMCTGLTPEKPQQWTALFGYSAEPLLSATGVFPRDDPYITQRSLLGRALSYWQSSSLARAPIEMQPNTRPKT